MPLTTRRRVPYARTITVAAAALTSVAVLAPVAGAHRTAHAAAAPSCKSSQLVTWLNTSPNGTAGTIFYNLQFLNLGGTCTLRGYPGVSAQALMGGQLGTPARRVSSTPVKTITLKTNQTAKAAVGIVDTGALPKSCHATTAAGLRVIAPNTSTTVVIPFPFSACGVGGQSSLTIRAVTK